MNNQTGHHLETRSAFTRLDLLAVLVVVGLLSLLTAAGVANDGASSETITCVQNQKQLIRAWQLYAEDNDGRLPVNIGGTSTTITNWVYGWISFDAAPQNTEPQYMLDPRYASLGPYVKQTQFFRCPSDLSKIVVPRTNERVPRSRSYSMNAAFGRKENVFLPDFQYRLYNRLSDLVNPTPKNHFVFIEEHPDSMAGCDFYVNMDGLNSPRSSRIVDFPAYFHNGSASVSFADGRVEVHRWSNPQTMPKVTYTGLINGSIASPNNIDVQWMMEHTSAVRSN